MQILTSLFSSICLVEHLYIYGPNDLLSEWKDAVEDTHWPDIFLQFTAVKNLYLSKEIAQCIVPILQELGVTDMLPALKWIFFEELKPSGLVQEAIVESVTGRRLFGFPLAASHWNRGRIPDLHS
jgi:hypothetical protein